MPALTGDWHCQLGEQHVPIVQPARGHAEHSDLVNGTRPRIDEVNHRCGDALESAVDKKRLERSEAQDPKAFELQLVALCRIEIKDPVCGVALPENKGVGACATEEKVETGAAADRVGPALAEERVIVRAAEDDVISFTTLDIVVPGIAVDQVVAVETPQPVIAVAAIQRIVAEFGTNEPSTTEKSPPNRKSVPSPPSRLSLPAPPTRPSEPRPPRRCSLASAPHSPSLPSPPSRVSPPEFATNEPSGLKSLPKRKSVAAFAIEAVVAGATDNAVVAAAAEYEVAPQKVPEVAADQVLDTPQHVARGIAAGAGSSRKTDIYRGRRPRVRNGVVSTAAIDVVGISVRRSGCAAC